MIGTIAKETKDRDNRARNIVIQGIPKSSDIDTTAQKTHDQTAIVKILDLIGADKTKVISHFRLTPRDATKTGPIIVTLPDEKERNNVLKLSNTHFRTPTNRTANAAIFINPDMIQSEKNLAWQLRTECKKRNSALPNTATTVYVIRGNQIKEITKTY